MSFRLCSSLQTGSALRDEPSNAVWPLHQALQLLTDGGEHHAAYFLEHVPCRLHSDDVTLDNIFTKAQVTKDSSTYYRATQRERTLRWHVYALKKRLRERTLRLQNASRTHHGASCLRSQICAERMATLVLCTGRQGSESEVLARARHGHALARIVVRVSLVVVAAVGEACARGFSHT